MPIISIVVPVLLVYVSWHRSPLAVVVVTLFSGLWQGPWRGVKSPWIRGIFSSQSASIISSDSNLAVDARTADSRTVSSGRLGLLNAALEAGFVLPMYGLNVDP